MSFRHLSVSALVLLGACASPAQRITARLTEYGIPPTQARCMGNGLNHRLSASQLQRLGEIGRTNKDRIGQMTIGEIVATLNRSGDTVLVAEVLRAGLSCAI